MKNELNQSGLRLFGQLECISPSFVTEALTYEPVTPVWKTVLKWGSIAAAFLFILADVVILAPMLTKKPGGDPVDSETVAGTEPETTPGTDAVTDAETDPETAPETEPETTPGTEPETTSGTEPETTPGTEPETTPETVSETTPETTPETSPETGPLTPPETEPVIEPGPEPSKDWTYSDGVLTFIGSAVPEGFAAGFPYRDQVKKLIVKADTIGKDAFRGMTNLSEVTLEGKTVGIPFGCFANCLSLERVIARRTITKIGSEAFMNCLKLKTLDPFGPLEEVGPYAFRNCQFWNQPKIFGENGTMLLSDFDAEAKSAYDREICLEGDGCLTYRITGEEEQVVIDIVLPQTYDLTNADELYFWFYASDPEPFTGNLAPCLLEVVSDGTEGENTLGYHCDVWTLCGIRKIGNWGLVSFMLPDSKEECSLNIDWKHFDHLRLTFTASPAMAGVTIGFDLLFAHNSGYVMPEPGVKPGPGSDPGPEPITKLAEGTGWYMDDTGVLHLTGAIQNPGEAHKSIDRTPWKDYKNEIRKVVTEKGASISSAHYLFSGCVNLTEADLTGLKTTGITSMRYLFYDCAKLTAVDLSVFDTSAVTDMAGLFCGCSGLTSIDLSRLNTASVTEMTLMFSGCSGLTSLDVKHLDTSRVIFMTGIFGGCSGLTSLDLSGFYTGKAEYMEGMFSGCSGLTSLDLRSFDTSRATQMSDMFMGCTNLKSVDLSSFRTSGVKSMSGMFGDCNSLTALDLSNFDTSSVLYFTGMFGYCGSLTSLDLSGFSTVSANEMSEMFTHCVSLTTLDVSRFYTSGVKSMREMFWGCESLTALDISSFDLSRVKSMYRMFRDCVSLKTLKTGPLFVSDYLPGPKEGVVFREMFLNCSSLVSLDLRGFYVRLDSIDYYYDMLRGCFSLTRLGVNETLVKYGVVCDDTGKWVDEETGIDVSDYRTKVATITGKAMLIKPE